MAFSKTLNPKKYQTENLGKNNLNKPKPHKGKNLDNRKLPMPKQRIKHLGDKISHKSKFHEASTDEDDQLTSPERPETLKYRRRISTMSLGQSYDERGGESGGKDSEIDNKSGGESDSEVDNESGGESDSEIDSESGEEDNPNGTEDKGNAGGVRVIERIEHPCKKWVKRYGLKRFDEIMGHGLNESVKTRSSFKWTPNTNRQENECCPCVKWEPVFSDIMNALGGVKL